MPGLSNEFNFKIPIEANVCIKINWERIYEFLKENPDISLDGFINNMVVIWESEENFIEVYNNE